MAIIMSTASKTYGSRVRFLDRDDLIRAVEDRHLVIDPFEPTCARVNGGYDLRIGQIASYRHKDVYLADDKPSIFRNFDSFVLRPGQRILFMAYERIEFPSDMIAEIYLRSRYAQLLNQAQHMGMVKRGWEGHLALEIANHSRDRAIRFSYKDPIVNLDIYQLERPLTE